MLSSVARRDRGLAKMTDYQNFTNKEDLLHLYVKWVIYGILIYSLCYTTALLFVGSIVIYGLGLIGLLLGEKVYFDRLRLNIVFLLVDGIGCLIFCRLRGPVMNRVKRYKASLLADDNAR